MYLSILDINQKKKFLELAYNIACSDGNYSADERLMMSQYCHEMDITFDESFEFINPLEEVITELNRICREKEKRIIVFEVIGLAMVDGNYDEEEKRIICGIRKVFGLPERFEDKCEEILNEYLSFQEKINNLVLN